MTVAEFLARASSSEITEWIALYILENEEHTARELKRATERGLAARKSRPAKRG